MIKEQILVFVDGELSIEEMIFVFVVLCFFKDVQDVWEDYYCIGEVLCLEEMDVFLSVGFLVKMSVLFDVELIIVVLQVVVVELVKVVVVVLVV